VPNVTTILIHPNGLFSEGLRRILSGTSFEPKQVVRTSDCVSPHLCNSEHELLFIVGGRDAPNAVKEVQATARKFQLARIVVVGDRIETKGVMSALEAGARGYLSDNMTSEVLVKALELVMLDETVLPAQFAKDLTRQLAQQQDVPACTSSRPHAPETETKVQQTPALSTREAAILKRLMQGSSNKAIAYKMAITEATVKVHVKSILRKIRARNRTQAAMWAVTNLSDAPDMPEEPIPAALNGNGAIGPTNDMHAAR
jgi:two-component system, NarL family, nitrate/nitrite response regulator NarL